MCLLTLQFKNQPAALLLHNDIFFELLSSTVTLFPVEETVNL